MRKCNAESQKQDSKRFNSQGRRNSLPIWVYNLSVVEVLSPKLRNTINLEFTGKFRVFDADHTVDCSIHLNLQSFSRELWQNQKIFNKFYDIHTVFPMYVKQQFLCTAAALRSMITEENISPRMHWNESVTGNKTFLLMASLSTWF